MKIKYIFLISCCILCSFRLFSADFLAENSNKVEPTKKERQLNMDKPSFWEKSNVYEQPQVISSKGEGTILRASAPPPEDDGNSQKISNQVPLGDYDRAFLLLLSVFALIFYFVKRKKINYL